MKIKQVFYFDNDFLKLMKMMDKTLNKLVGSKRNPKANCCLENEIYTNIYIMYDDTNPVGSIAFTSIKDGVSKIGRVFVCEKYRNLGIATKLFKKAERVLKKQGAKTLTLDTYERLPKAMSLYRNLGFEVMSLNSESNFSSFYMHMFKNI